MDAYMDGESACFKWKARGERAPPLTMLPTPASSGGGMTTGRVNPRDDAPMLAAKKASPPRVPGLMSNVPLSGRGLKAWPRGEAPTLEL